MPNDLKALRRQRCKKKLKTLFNLAGRIAEQEAHLVEGRHINQQPPEGHGVDAGWEDEIHATESRMKSLMEELGILGEVFVDECL